MRIAIPCEESGGRLYISPHFGKARYFAVYEVHGDSVRRLALEENPIATVEHSGGKGRVIIDQLLRHGVNAVIVHGIGPGAFYNLREAGVRIYLADRVTPIEEILNLFKEGKLSEAEKPIEHGHS